MNKFKAAINELRAGNENSAWAIAKADKSLNSEVVKEQWLKWAYKTELYNKKTKESLLLDIN